MNAGQYEGVMAMLGEIRDRMPVRDVDSVVHPFQSQDGTSCLVVLGQYCGRPEDDVVHRYPPAPDARFVPRVKRAGWPYDREGPAPVPNVQDELVDQASRNSVVAGIAEDAGCSSRDLAGAVVKAMADEDRLGSIIDTATNRGAHKALTAMLAVLDGWIEGAQHNHEGSGHRDSDCCRSFEPADIRNMVADACREVGIPIVKGSE